MRAALIYVLLLLGGCALYAPRSAEEMVQLTKNANTSGCVYLRGNVRPYADVSFLQVATWGKGVDYQDCLQAIPQEARSMLAPPMQ